MSEIIRNIKNNVINVLGWRTDRKIIVIESDDWGAIRMPSREVYNLLLKSGYAVDKRPYEKYDSLASTDDLSLLFDVLNKHKDKNGKSPVFTANTIVANPDFDKIKSSGYETYHYELFTDTQRRYPCCNDSFDLWKEGMSLGLFYPQFHGREHINVASWMKALQSKDKDVLFAFEQGIAGIFPKENPQAGNQFVVALKYTNEEESENLKKLLIDGLSIFERIFGYRSTTFIAPCNRWNPNLSATLKSNGVNSIQGSSIQIVPEPDGEKKLYHYMGEKNKYGQSFLIRNCLFEPSEYNNFDNIDRCMFNIKTAFRWKKPAIISSHRINYMGTIFPENRDQNLKMLDVLLKKIIQIWPDVEFMTSDQLGYMIGREH